MLVISSSIDSIQKIGYTSDKEKGEAYMKKLLLMGILLLSIILFCGCKKQEKNNIEQSKDDVNFIIEDEVKWKEAFEKFDFKNFSMSITNETLNSKKTAHIRDDEGYFTFDYITQYSGDLEYIKNYKEMYLRNEIDEHDKEINKEYDSGVQEIKFSDGTITYSTYDFLHSYDYDTLDEALANRIWYDGFSSYSPQGYQKIVHLYTFEIPLTDFYQKFKYNESEKNYTYNGRINGSIPNEDGTTRDELICINPVITFYLGKVSSINFKYERIDKDDKKMNGEMNYYDIGTTKIPQAVLDAVRKIK